MLHITFPKIQVPLPFQEFFTQPISMGNCLVLQHDKVVRILKTDGNILQYKTPIKVHQVLSEFSHHAISDKLPAIKHLHPNTEMIERQLYYLLPLPVPPVKKKTKKSVRFSDDVTAGEGGVVRIKLVISKQELQALLRDGGFSVGEMQKGSNTDKFQDFEGHDREIDSKGRFSVLESIPEVC